MRAVAPAEIAWIVLLPCALVTVAAIVLLGPPLGRAILSPGSNPLWPAIPARPQPLEHGRFLVGLLGAPLTASVVLAAAKARPRARGSTIRALVVVNQLALLGVVVVCFAAQSNVVLSADFILQPHTDYFTWTTLAVSLALLPLALVLLRRPRIAARAAALLRDRRGWRLAGLLLAGIYLVMWMSTAINADRSIENVNEAVANHLLTTMAEPFAVLNGRTPLVNFHAQYGQVWAYLAAAPMAAFGASIAVYTTVMAAATALAMLGVYGILRRITRSSLATLVLFLPVVGTGFFTIVGPLSNRYGPANLYIQWPLRYSGPVLLAWLTARHVDGAWPRRAWLLFAAGGLVAVNNTDFGASAVVATLVALVFAAPRRSWRAVARLAGQALGAMLAAIALFAAFTLARSGSLPHVGFLFEFPRLFGVVGWEQLPMPELGLHLIVFLTFAAALVLATVRVAGGDGDLLLTSMLAWTGTFGLLASTYFAGRAHPMGLFDFFAPWALVLALLTVLVMRSLAARAWRRPTVPELAVLFGFGLAICSLPQTPTPWSQVSRIRDTAEIPILKQPEATRFVAADTRPGERVAILIALGHRIAYDLRIVNLSPYASVELMPTNRQLQTAIRALRAAHGRKLFVSRRLTYPEVLKALQASGFAIVRRAPSLLEDQLLELRDRSGGRG